MTNTNYNTQQNMIIRAEKRESTLTNHLRFDLFVLKKKIEYDEFVEYLASLDISPAPLTFANYFDKTIYMDERYLFLFPEYIAYREKLRWDCKSLDDYKQKLLTFYVYCDKMSYYY